AITHLRKSIQLGNNSAPVHYNLGIAHLQSNRPDDGIRELRSAMALDPTFLAAAYPLGVALMDVGRTGEALPFLEKAQVATSHDPRVWASLARAQFELGNPDAALRTTDQAVEAVPRNIGMIA